MHRTFSPLDSCAQAHPVSNLDCYAQLFGRGNSFIPQDLHMYIGIFTPWSIHFPLGRLLVVPRMRGATAQSRSFASVDLPSWNHFLLELRLDFLSLSLPLFGKGLKSILLLVIAMIWVGRAYECLSRVFINI